MALLFERSISICGLLSELHIFSVSQSYICSHCWRLFPKHLLTFLHSTRNNSCIQKTFANGNGKLVKTCTFVSVYWFMLQKLEVWFIKKQSCGS